MRLQISLIADEAAPLQFDQLRAGLQAAQAATPTAVASARLGTASRQTQVLAEWLGQLTVDRQQRPASGSYVTLPDRKPL